MSTASGNRRGTSHRARTARLAHLIGSVAAIVLLAGMPPALPDFGPSLATPLTTSTLARLALVLLWIVCLALALVFLRQALFPARTLSPPPWALRAAPRKHRAMPRLDRRVPPTPRLIVAPRVGDTPPPTSENNAAHAALSPDSGTAIRISLLGPITIEGIKRPRRATTVELLAYLALHKQGASRDQLLEAIWPGEDPRRSRPRLWQSVSEARRLLGETFERDGEHYRLDRTRIAVDVDELEQLLPRIETAAADGVKPLVNRALALWRGQPMSGIDYAWADAHIRHLEATLSKLAIEAARVCLESGDPNGALQAAEHGLEIDDLNEPLVRVALEAEASLGRREAVRDRYETLRKALEDRLGLEPERATRMQYRELLGQHEL